MGRRKKGRGREETRKEEDCGKEGRREEEKEGKERERSKGGEGKEKGRKEKKGRITSLQFCTEKIFCAKTIRLYL